MDSIHGPPRLLTDAQVRFIVSWGVAKRAWRDHLKTKAALAESLGVAVRTVERVLARLTKTESQQTRHSRPGGPRIIADADAIAAIEAWHLKSLQLRAALNGLVKISAMASEMEVSCATIDHILRNGGRYKQISPERRPLGRSRALREAS
jgi:hypothetical protein